MSYTTTKTTSYGQRLSGSFKGIATGFLLFVAGSILLFWNEGNFVKTKKSIQEAEGIVIHIDDVSSVDPELNGRLIHASAYAGTQDILTDDLFDVSENAISISRKVTYYQYEERSKSETRDRIGGGQETITTYTYEKQWTAAPVNSRNFHDPAYQSSNFVLTTVDDKTEQSKNVTFGGYRLPAFIISSISGSIPADVKLTPEDVQRWENIINRPNTAQTPIVHPNANDVYFGESPANPQIGDVRITFSKILPADISIIAKVNGSTFEQYIASNGKSFSQVNMGTVSAENMFAGAHTSNNMMAWILRIIGVILVVSGLKSMFSILPALFKVIPFLGSIVNAGVGLVCTVFGAAWSLIIIALAWLWYRPLTGIILLTIAIAGIWFLKKKGRDG